MSATVKIFTKAELFDKTMTLKKLQTICTALGVEFETDANKAALANMILKKQRDLAINSPEAGEPEREDVTVAVGEPVAETVREEVAAETVREEVAAENAAASVATGEGMQEDGETVRKTDEELNPPGKTEAPEGHVEMKAPESPGIPAHVIAELKEALALPTITERLDRLDRSKEAREARDKEREDRLQRVEKAVEGILAHSKHGNTLHGSIDNLPKIENLPPPGTLDDLPKIG